MKIAAFGEVMLRFTPPEYLMLEQTEQLRMNFVGTGVNLLANLAHFQLETALITKLPANRLGEAGKAALRKLGISDQWVGEKGDHIGSFCRNGLWNPTHTSNLSKSPSECFWHQRGEGLRF